MRVFILFNDDVGGFFPEKPIEAVFNSLEKAEAYAAAMGWGDGEIEEWEVEWKKRKNESGVRNCEQWRCRIVGPRGTGHANNKTLIGKKNNDDT